MSRLNVVIPAMFVFGALMLAVPPSSANEVSGGELSRILPGKTILGGNKECNAATYVLEPMTTGALRGPISGDCDGKKDSGQWWVAGDKFCRQFTKFGEGKLFCYDVKKEADGALAFYRSDGSKSEMRVKD